MGYTVVNENVIVSLLRPCQFDQAIARNDTVIDGELRMKMREEEVSAWMYDVSAERRGGMDEQMKVYRIFSGAEDYSTERRHSVVKQGFMEGVTCGGDVCL